jgi:hypothetical protein
METSFVEHEFMAHVKNTINGLQVGQRTFDRVVIITNVFRYLTNFTETRPNTTGSIKLFRTASDRAKSILTDNHLEVTHEVRCVLREFIRKEHTSHKSCLFRIKNNRLCPRKSIAWRSLCWQHAANMRVVQKYLDIHMCRSMTHIVLDYINK